MKLQDKETNEIIEIEIRQVNDDNLKDRPLTTIDGGEITLEKLKEKYVDYEEPIEFWTIDIMEMQVAHIYERRQFRIVSDKQIANLEELGLKFETKKEAEKAVEKLKAWKRLKDEGFKFECWKRDDMYCGDFTIEATDQTFCDDKDLDLLFGGDE